MPALSSFAAFPSEGRPSPPWNTPQNGRFGLRVIGHPDYGLPFGQDRLLLIWITSLATWQKNRIIRFNSAATILETFELPKDGRYYRRLVEGFERIFYATFFFSSDQRDGECVVIERHSFRFVRDIRLWYRQSSGDSPRTFPKTSLCCPRSSGKKFKTTLSRWISRLCVPWRTLQATWICTFGWFGDVGLPRPKCTFLCSDLRDWFSNLEFRAIYASVISVGKSGVGC